jgi:predicted Fe-Mo cluster-binding NifX family protein
MKIAVAAENGCVSGHFGKCEQFTIFETDDKKIIGKERLDTRAHGLKSQHLMLTYGIRCIFYKVFRSQKRKLVLIID